MAKTMEIERKKPLGRRAAFFVGRSCLLAATILHPAEALSITADAAHAIGSVGMTIINLANTHDEQSPGSPIVVATPTSEVSQIEPSPVVSEPVAQEVSFEQLLGTEVDGWVLAPNYTEIINNLSIEQYKKDFLVRTINGIYVAMHESAKKGYVTNPLVLTAQVAIETGYGNDTLSSPANNFTGAKAYGNDPYIRVKTREVIKGKSVYKYLKFRKYDRPADSFNDYIRSMNELHWYSDAIGCRLDFRKYALALQNELDPKTCELLARQGDPSILYPEDKIVKSYASDTGYVGAIKDVIHGLELEKVFVRVP